MAHLLVTIDTEEEGLWGGTYRRTGNTVRNIEGVPRFQELCDRYGVRPTYLVDAPVVEDDAASHILKAIQDDGRCEIGTHVHPWCNPPFDEEITKANSYLCNLPIDLQRHKIEWLTEAIADRFGRRPTSFRAGRYGLDAYGARILADLGYVVDSSVIPFTDYSAQAGPNFDSAPCDPYWIDENDLTQPSEMGRLLEVPVTVGYSRKNFDQAHSLRKKAMAPFWNRLKAVGILDRLGIAKRIKLSPEQADATSMNRLIDVSLKRGAKCLVLMFHSSSLQPGFSPYVRHKVDLQQFFDRLTAVFENCRSHQLKSLTLTAFGEHSHEHSDLSEREFGPAVESHLVDCSRTATSKG